MNIESGAIDGGGGSATKVLDCRTTIAGVEIVVRKGRRGVVLDAKEKETKGEMRVVWSRKRSVRSVGFHDRKVDQRGNLFVLLNPLSLPP